MLNPQNHFGKVWLFLSLGSAEFFVFRSPHETGMTDQVITAVLGALFMYVTFLPALLIVVLIYAAFGWLD